MSETLNPNVKIANWDSLAKCFPSLTAMPFNRLEGAPSKENDVEGVLGGLDTNIWDDELRKDESSKVDLIDDAYDGVCKGALACLGVGVGNGETHPTMVSRPCFLRECYQSGEFTMVPDFG